LSGVGEASLRYSKSPDFSIWHLEKKSIANVSLTLSLLVNRANRLLVFCSLLDTFVDKLLPGACIADHPLS